MRAAAVPPPPRALLLAASLAAGAFAVAGCGSSKPANAADPASVVPASAEVYAEAEVRPQGAKAAEALAAGKKLSHMAQPYLGLLAELMTPGSAPLSYGRDVAPWLGRRAALYLTSASAASALLPVLQQGLLGGGSSAPAFGAAGVDGALVLDTTDAGRARAFLERQAGRAGAHASSYRGTAYEVAPSGLSFGMVGSFAVIGSEAALRAVVETHAGSSSLARSPQYSALASKAPPEAVAHVYTTPPAAGAAPLPGPLGLLAGNRIAYISASLHAAALTLVADTQPPAQTPAIPGLLSAAGAEAAAALAQLPGESWLALGLGKLGSTLGTDATGLRELAGLLGPGSESGATTGISIKGLITGLLTPLEALAGRTAAARARFASWAGAGGVFASGTGLLELMAAVVIESTQPALARAALGELASELRKAGDTTQAASIPGTEAAIGVRVPGLPVMLDVAVGTRSSGQTALVLGLGEAAVEQALHPSSTMASSPARTAAASALGEGNAPSVIFQTPTLVALLEGIGLGEDPNVARILSYLHAVGPIYGGGHALGAGSERFKLVVSLQG